MGLDSPEREDEGVAGLARGGAGVPTLRARQCPAERAAGAGLALLAYRVGAGRAGWLACITAGMCLEATSDHPFYSTGWTIYSTWPTESRGNSAPTPLPLAPCCPSSDPCPDRYPPHLAPGMASLAMSAPVKESIKRFAGCGD